MKQYTSPGQTAKLIELGFEKPKSYHDIEWDGMEAYDYQIAYSIGELVEMLGYDLYSIHYKGLAWEVKSERVETREPELIDALYEMAIKLKEEEII